MGWPSWRSPALVGRKQEAFACGYTFGVLRPVGESNLGPHLGGATQSISAAALLHLSLVAPAPPRRRWRTQVGGSKPGAQRRSVRGGKPLREASCLCDKSSIDLRRCA